MLKSRLKPGQFADLAELNVPYLDVEDEDLCSIESELTVIGGRIVQGASEFEGLAASLEALETTWSPVNT